MPVLVAALDLVVPRRCGGCGRPGEVLCAACRPTRPPAIVPVPGVAVAAAGWYDGGLRRALIGYKERRRTDLSAPLGALLAGAVRVVRGREAALVPIPTDRRAARARGGDHALRLARVAARRCGLPVVRALGQAHAVRDSAGLGRRERAANRSGSMVATRAPFPGATAVLVDDIVTTGATLREAARALESAGWRVAGAAVVAATPRRGGADLPPGPWALAQRRPAS